MVFYQNLLQVGKLMMRTKIFTCTIIIQSRFVNKKKEKSINFVQEIEREVYIKKSDKFEVLPTAFQK